MPTAAVPALWSWAHCLSLQAWTLSPASEWRQWAALVPFGSLPAERRENQRMTSGEQGMEEPCPSGHLDQSRTTLPPPQACMHLPSAALLATQDDSGWRRGVSKGLSWHPRQVGQSLLHPENRDFLPLGGCPGAQERRAFSLRLLRASCPSTDLWTPRTLPGRF